MKAGLIILIFLLQVAAVCSSFNESMTRYLIWPMASSAYSDTPEKCVKDNFKKSEFKRRYSVNCDMLPIDFCVAFSAVSHSDKAIILSFRGSTLAEFKTELINAISTPPISAFNGKAHVNSYFLNAFTSIFNGGGMKDDFLTLKNANHGYDLWITGHSLGKSIKLLTDFKKKINVLGAAMASLAATTIVTNKLFPANKIKLVTFGQPRVGDVSYANLVDSIIPHSYRIIHQNDVVPSSPPEWLFGYHHHKSEIWFNNDMTPGQKYIECDEDESQKCSDGAFNMDMIEHLWYYNVLANFAANGCQGWNIHK